MPKGTTLKEKEDNIKRIKHWCKVVVQGQAGVQKKKTESQQNQSQDQLEDGRLPKDSSPSSGPGGGPESVTAAIHRIGLQQLPSLTPQLMQMMVHQ
ncbi:hypothetical protein PTI98_010021 [Pleurotus ostreatus]|nr:hypothetical protein PTI98_010021 [Pleurotus ostreatus]